MRKCAIGTENDCSRESDASLGACCLRSTPVVVLHAGFPFVNLLHVEGTGSVLASPSECMTFGGKRVIWPTVQCAK